MCSGACTAHVCVCLCLCECEMQSLWGAAAPVYCPAAATRQAISSPDLLHIGSHSPCQSLEASM
jgi:hypothetical protein